MTSPTDPAPEGDIPSEEEFEAWMRAHPENADYFVELIARTEKGEFGEVPVEMRDLVGVILAKHKAAKQLLVVQRLLQSLSSEIRRLQEDDISPETLLALNARCNEIIDATLDLPEPHRTSFLSDLLTLRDALRAIGGESL